MDVSAPGLAQLVQDFQATEAQAEAAFRSTLNRMAQWLRTRSVRDLSGKLKLQQKILRRRLKTFRLQGGRSARNVGEVKVWYGLNDIPLSWLKPREASGGVRAQGGRFVEGAFIAKLHGKPQVLKRVGKARVPLEVQYAAIANDAQEYIEDFVLADAEFENRFMETFTRELRWRTRILN